MKLQPGRTRTLSRLSSALVVIALVFGMISGCVLGESKDDDLHQTETALAEQQTKIAQTQASSGLQSTVDALQGTVNAQNVQATANAALPPTLSPEQVQQTSQALEATKQPTQIPQQPPTLPPSAPTNPPPRRLPRLVSKIICATPLSSSMNLLLEVGIPHASQNSPCNKWGLPMLRM